MYYIRQTFLSSLEEGPGTRLSIWRHGAWIMLMPDNQLADTNEMSHMFSIQNEICILTNSQASAKLNFR